ncbi:hypothetical protein GYMLUDRAFT_251200 [Collybiopsis luxurians FD-317 M1]|uniref:Uncharacterized protein n=1 Tax=Collybiopsis luxurians FD-317 M1 TaxID=944289 RepID=A0A0D0C3Y7_9AGAR|nr:hypothetical protein GYMLUDRAFT_251200 [Collybiopsis luxurians FD-317 M1]
MTNLKSSATLLAAGLAFFLLRTVSAIPFPVPVEPPSRLPSVPHLHARHVVHYQRSDANAASCVNLTVEDVKRLPGWSKLEATANERWGKGDRNVVTNDERENEFPAQVCIASEHIKVRFTGQPSCQTNQMPAGGNLTNTNGTLWLSTTQGSTASLQATISQSATIGVNKLFMATLDFPEVASGNEAFTTDTSITNSLTKSFTSTYNEMATVTLMMSVFDGKKCDAKTTVKHCTLQGTGEMRLIANGYVLFEYEDKVAEKGGDKKDKHFKWPLKLEDVLTEDERSSSATFQGSFVSTTRATYNGTCN